MKKALMIAAAAAALTAGGAMLQPSPAAATVRLYLDFGGPYWGPHCYRTYKKVKVGKYWNKKKKKWVSDYKWRWVKVCR